MADCQSNGVVVGDENESWVFPHSNILKVGLPCSTLSRLILLMMKLNIADHRERTRLTLLAIKAMENNIRPDTGSINFFWTHFQICLRFMSLCEKNKEIEVVGLYLKVLIQRFEEKHTGIFQIYDPISVDFNEGTRYGKPMIMSVIAPTELLLEYKKEWDGEKRECLADLLEIVASFDSKKDKTGACTDAVQPGVV